MDLAMLQATLRQFAAERNWEEFHTPKNLATALMIEAAELAEIFQWMTPEQSQAAHQDKVVQERIADEVADVLLYLLQLADHSAIDLKRAVGKKLVKNATKHPPTKPGVPLGSVAPLNDQTHVLVDWENVQPKDVDILNLAPATTNIWIFHGLNQKKVDANQKSFGDNLTLIPITRSGKNALDFHLSFYMGYIASRNPQARFVVVSNDQGYGPMLEHAKALGFAASQIGFATKAVLAKVSTAKKAASKLLPAAKVAASKKVPKVKGPVAAKKIVPKAVAKKATLPKPPPAKMPATANQQKADSLEKGKAYAHVIASLRKAKHPPTRLVRLRGLVKSLLDGGKAHDVAVEMMLHQLDEDGYVSIDAKGGVTINH